MPNTPSCPRCGYDLSGITATWADHCPTRGTCSECGLDFEWADLLNPMRSILPGLLEHARGAGQSLRWTLVTIAWMILPRRFWSRVQMHHEVRFKPVVISTIVIAILAQAAAGICICASYFSSFPPSPENPLMNEWRMIASSFLDPFLCIRPTPLGGASILESPLVQSRLAVDCLVGIIGFQLAWPVLFAALPATRSKAQLRWKHFMRATVYPILALVILLVANRVDAVVNPGSFLVHGPQTSVVPTLALIAWLGVYLLWPMLPCWTAAWWYAAMRKGWKLEHSFLLWSLLFIAAFLMGCLSIGALHVLESGLA